MSPGWQAAQGSYDSWVAGYMGANGGSVSEVSESGDTVYVTLTTPQSCLSGWYQVDNGLITTGDLNAC